MYRKVVIWILAMMPWMVFAQQLHTTIEVAHPAKMTFRHPVANLLIVNNTVTQPQDFGHNTRIDGQDAGDASVDLYQAAFFCIMAVGEQLDSYGIMNSILDDTQNNSGHFYSRTLLSYDQEEALCDLYQSDALLILNQIVIYDIHESFQTVDYTYAAYTEAYSSCHWTIHYAGRQEDKIFSTADTLSWENESYSRQSAVAELPDRQSALLEMAAYSGEDLGRLFLPSITKEDRYLYSNKDTEAGEQFFVRRQWDQAIEAWKEIYTTYLNAKKNGVKPRSLNSLSAAYAAANMAVTAEMMGDYSLACDYANASIEVFGSLSSSDAQQQEANLRHYLGRLQVLRAEANVR